MTNARLQCLGGEPPPAELAGDISAVSMLSEAARDELWSALGPSLPDPLPVEAEAQLDAFCARHGVNPDHLGLVLRACRFLLRAAFARGMNEAQLQDDLRKLTRDEQVIAAIASGYERARRSLTEHALQRALDLHGDSLRGIDFRVDQIKSTRDAPHLDAFVANIALELGRGGDRRTVSFQADLAAVGALKDACEEIQRRARR